MCDEGAIRDCKAIILFIQNRIINIHFKQAPVSNLHQSVSSLLTILILYIYKSLLRGFFEFNIRRQVESWVSEEECGGSINRTILCESQSITGSIISLGEWWSNINSACSSKLASIALIFMTNPFWMLFSKIDPLIQHILDLW